MAIVRTPKGTASDKTGAVSLTIPNVEVQQHSQLLVAVGYDVGQGNPDVFWGPRQLRRRPFNDNGNGVALSVYRFHRDRATQTNDLVITWANTPNGQAPTAKAAFATMVQGVSAEQNEFTPPQGQAQAATSAPSSGALQATNFPDQFLLGAFAAEGPQNNDTPGTPSLGFTRGQRAGTNGAPPVSNITIEETFLITTATGNFNAAQTGSAERDWVSCMIAIEPAYPTTRNVTITIEIEGAADQAEADTVMDTIISQFPDDWQVTVT